MKPPAICHLNNIQCGYFGPVRSLSMKNRIIIAAPALFTAAELEEFEAQILSNKSVNEQDASAFFQRFPRFLLGGDYATLRPEVMLYRPNGEVVYRVDFCRCKFGSDYWDFVELKSPTSPFLVKQGQHWKFGASVQGGL